MNNGSSHMDTSIDFTIMIIQDTRTGKFTGIVKEIEGVIVQASSEAEVMENIPRAIKAILRAINKEKNHTDVSWMAQPNVTQRRISFELETV